MTRIQLRRVIKEALRKYIKQGDENISSQMLPGGAEKRLVGKYREQDIFDLIRKNKGKQLGHGWKIGDYCEIPYDKYDIYIVFGVSEKGVSVISEFGAIVYSGVPWNKIKKTEGDG